MRHETREIKVVRGLAAYDVAMEAVVSTLKALDGLRGPADLVDQARRAAISIPLNIAEGAGRRGRDRKYHFSIALGSTKEVMAALELMFRLDMIAESTFHDLITLLDRLGGLLAGLTRM